jgi:acetyltransferase-like isoleucine patch superfamily enzyme
VTGWRAFFWTVARAVDPVRLLALLRKVGFLLRTECGKSLYVTHRAELLLHGDAQVVIGASAIIDGTLECYSRGRIQIGDHVFFGRSRIYAAVNVIIGNYVLISDNVCIMDSDLHPIDHARRRALAEQIDSGNFYDVYTDIDARPVTIHSDVWIGNGAAILKGVTIGQGAIVGAGAVVTKDVAPWTVVGGVPAKLVRYLKHDH